MIRLFLYAILILATLTVNGQQQLKVDPVNSTVDWTGYAGVGNYAPKGTIRVKSGTLLLKNNMLISGLVVVDMPTIKNENTDLQEHLKNADFFDVAKYPTATFRLSKENLGIVTGVLYIKGISRKISFPIVKVFDKQPFLTGKVTIDRTLFNIKYNSASFFQDLGSYAIKNEFDLEIKLYLQ